MTQRIINDTFWTDPYIEDLDPSEKLIFIYLLSNPLCNIAWAYEIKTKRIAYETWFDKDMVEKILTRFQKDNKIMLSWNWIILINFAKNQTNNPNVLKWMQRIIDSIPESIVKSLKGFESLPYFTLLYLTLPNYTILNSTSDESEINIIENNNIFKTISNDEILEKYEITKEELDYEIQEFINFWTAPMQKWKNKWIEKWKVQDTFVANLRFATWLWNNKKWNKRSSNNNNFNPKPIETDEI